jgi:hypothetical protein
VKRIEISFFHSLSFSYSLFSTKLTDKLISKHEFLTRFPNGEISVDYKLCTVVSQREEEIEKRGEE